MQQKDELTERIVAGAMILEIKAVAKLPEFATAQVLSYLKATGLKRGLLLNVSESRLVESSSLMRRLTRVQCGRGRSDGRELLRRVPWMHPS
jgi:GxxExxY protein